MIHRSRGNNWRLRERDLNRGFRESQDATMFETISVPLLTSIITPLSIIFCLLCLLATTVIFLYWREKCEKGSDVSNSLLLIVSMSNLANSIVSALVIVSIFTHSNKGTFLPCVLFNINNFSRKVQLIAVLLLSVLVTWRKLFPDYYVSVRQCALKRISGLASFALFAYQIFVDMMICNKRAFCPKEIKCRMLIGSLFICASIVALTLTTICLIVKSCLEVITTRQTPPNLESTLSLRPREVTEEMEMEETTFRRRRLGTVLHGQETSLDAEEAEEADAPRRDPSDHCEARTSRPLPAFRNTRTLSLSTSIFILYSNFLNFFVPILILNLTGNVVLIETVELMISTFLPLFTVLLEKDILSFLKLLVQRQIRQRFFSFVNCRIQVSRHIEELSISNLRVCMVWLC